MASSNLISLEGSDVQEDKDKDVRELEITDTTIGERMVGTPLLFQAVEENNLVSVKKILKQGVNPNVKNITGKTPLMIAVELENVETILTLLDAEADPNIKDDSGNTPLSIVLTKIYESKESFDTTLKKESVLKDTSLENLLRLFTREILNENTFLIITALASYGPCKNALLEKSSDYKTRVNKTK